MYNILMKNKRSDPEEKLPWFRPPGSQCVSRQWTHGFVAAEKDHYPCPDIRIILCDPEDPIRGEGTIVEEIPGNGTVHINQNNEEPDSSVPLLKPQYLTERYDPKCCEK